MNLSSDTAYVVASKMNYDQLSNLCRTNMEFARYCNESRFQQLKKKALINKWIDTILNMAPNSQYEFILVDDDDIGHEIIITKRKNKTIDFSEKLLGVSFLNSLLYRLYFQPLFKTIPTFSEVIANNRTRYNIILHHYNQIDNDINQIRNSIERKYHTQIMLDDTLAPINDYTYNSEVQNARQQIRALLQIPKQTGDNYTFTKQNIDVGRLARLIALILDNYQPKFIYNNPPIGGL